MTALGVTGMLLAGGSLALTPFGATASDVLTASSSERVFSVLEAHGIDYTGEVIIRQEITVLGQGAAGYVPLLSPGEAIYLLDEETFEDLSLSEWFDSTVIHEYGHILQKQVIEEHCVALLTSSAVCALELDALLASQTATRLTRTPFTGLETNADCILQSYSVTGLTAYEPEVCSVTQLASALALRQGLWPTEDVLVSLLPEADILHRELEAATPPRSSGKASPIFEKASSRP